MEEVLVQVTSAINFDRIPFVIDGGRNEARFEDRVSREAFVEFLPIHVTERCVEVKEGWSTIILFEDRDGGIGHIRAHKFDPHPVTKESLCQEVDCQNRGEKKQGPVSERTLTTVIEHFIVGFCENIVQSVG